MATNERAKKVEDTYLRSGGGDSASSNSGGGSNTIPKNTVKNLKKIILFFRVINMRASNVEHGSVALSNTIKKAFRAHSTRG